MEKVVLSLDAGGTNLVFNAMSKSRKIGESYSLPAQSVNLEEQLKKIIHGFKQVNQRVEGGAQAISFCFPGPADYNDGIIGDLENLPLFKNGVALKKMLENEFRIPVFINNDGDLFTLGEAINGLLPATNKALHAQGNQRQYKNLLGLTLGTGFGAGIVTDGKMLVGDNSAGAEINRMSHPFEYNTSVEETLSIRGVQMLFAQEDGCAIDNTPSPYDIFKIGAGVKKGNREAAVNAWNIFGRVLGEAAANAITLIDGIIVIGGGLSGAYPLFLPEAVKSMNRQFEKRSGGKFPRLEVIAFNLEGEESMAAFLKDSSQMINVPFSEEQIAYNADKKVGLGISKLGTSEAVSVGAYAFAADQLDWS